MFSEGDTVKVATSHRFPEWHGKVGKVIKYIPFGKYYVRFRGYTSKVVIDQNDLKKD